MERNWLIRTTQNQILGPVAKAKVLEFLEKGALGPDDEVCSGNGYWFSLKEKDLVEKYLYGDIPQSYNPISESKSILSKRENPDKTTSINNSPANSAVEIAPKSEEEMVLPTKNDLEFPDITLIQTDVGQKLNKEEAKLPDELDLEFPDIASIESAVNETPISSVEEIRPIEMKSRPVMTPGFPKEVQASNDAPVVYPDSDDLAFPEIEVKTEDSKLRPPEVVPEVASKEIRLEKTDPVIIPVKKDKQVSVTHHEDKKLLHDRKTKIQTTSKETNKAASKETPKPLPKEEPQRLMPEHLKKRNDNYLMYILVIIILIIVSLFFYYWRNILNKPLPV